MGKTKVIYITLLFILGQTNGHSQTDLVLQGNDTIIGNYQVTEKIILETDRELYMVGERINVACSTYEPILQKILHLSKIVYIEFYSSENLIIDQLKVEMNMGHGSGFIEIPKRLSSGRYYIRAYTNYMKNFGCTVFSYYSVSVLNPFREISQDDPDILFIPSLQKCSLYPEGGQVVYGCPNTIICVFSDTTGHPVPCMVKVLDNNNQIISKFTTNAYGLGSFSFTPTHGKRYHVEATTGTDLIKKNIEIPESSIIIIKVYQDQNELRLKVLNNHFTKYPLRLEVYYSNADLSLITINTNDSLISVPLQTLPKGIIQFRLRDIKNRILSYRNVYNPPVRRMEMKLHTNQKEYRNREPVELTIEQSPLNLMKGALSVSVVLIEQRNLQDYLNDDNHKFLQSALYPFLYENPYPASIVMKDSLFLEGVLIAKKFDDFMPDGPPIPGYKDLAFFPEIKKDLIFGMIVDENKIPVAYSPVIQTWTGTISNMQTTRTNEKGKFIFQSGKNGMHELILTQRKNSSGKIVLQEEFFPEFFPLAKEDISVIPEKMGELKQQLLNLQINDSYYEKKEGSVEEHLVPFYVAADKVFKIADYIPLSTLEEFLFEVVPGVLISHSKGKTFIRMHFPHTDLPLGDDPLFLVDGIPIFDADLVGKLRCSDLLSIGIVYEKYFYQNENFDGIFDIHTRAGDASILEIPESIYSVNFTGIQQAHKNDDNSIWDINSREPFFRTQLYWNPSVDLNASGKATVTFTAPDNTGDYLIRSGLKSTDGSFVYYYTTFHVK
jgi:hypothetical protein